MTSGDAVRAIAAALRRLRIQNNTRAQEQYCIRVLAGGRGGTAKRPSWKLLFAFRIRKQCNVTMVVMDSACGRLSMATRPHCVGARRDCRSTACLCSEQGDFCGLTSVQQSSTACNHLPAYHASHRPSCFLTLSTPQLRLRTRLWEP